MEVKKLKDIRRQYITFFNPALKAISKAASYIDYERRWACPECEKSGAWWSYTMMANNGNPICCRCDSEMCITNAYRLTVAGYVLHHTSIPEIPKRRQKKCT
jgi:hypothetical protein